MYWWRFAAALLVDTVNPHLKQDVKAHRRQLRRVNTHRTSCRSVKWRRWHTNTTNIRRQAAAPTPTPGGALDACVRCNPTHAPGLAWARCSRVLHRILIILDDHHIELGHRPPRSRLLRRLDRPRAHSLDGELAPSRRVASSRAWASSPRRCSRPTLAHNGSRLGCAGASTGAT